MVKAIWNDTVIAESDETVVVEGNHDFPPDSLATGHIRESATQSACPWKGMARLLHDRCWRPGKCGCRLVLPEPEAGSLQDRREGRILAGRQGRNLSPSLCRNATVKTGPTLPPMAAVTPPWILIGGSAPS
jgi:hypothetical protein